MIKTEIELLESTAAGSGSLLSNYDNNAVFLLDTIAKTKGVNQVSFTKNIAATLKWELFSTRLLPTTGLPAL